MTDKQKRFVEEYLVDFNATQAAIRSGYSEGTSYSIGQENLRKPEIKTEIDARLDLLSMQAGEITKRITNLARGDMSDYLVKKQVPHTPQIKVGLQVVIDRMQAEIDFEDEFASLVTMDEEEIENHKTNQEYRKREMLRCQLELKRNPYATRIIDGETEMVEIAELDLIKIMEDKERGIIKSYKNTKDGVQVELYAADAALAQLAKIRKLTSDKEVEVNLNVDTVVKVGYGDGDSNAG